MGAPTPDQEAARLAVAASRRKVAELEAGLAEARTVLGEDLARLADVGAPTDDQPGEGRLTEADLTFNDLRQLVEVAVSAKVGGTDRWVWVRDMADDWAVYSIDGPGYDGTLWRVAYTVDEAGQVTLAEAEKVVEQTSFMAVAEARDVMPGRVLEAKGNAGNGGRIFRMQLIEAGDSKNGRRYTEAVLSAAASLYEGAKAYDHHRTQAELASSTIDGLVGSFRNVEATTAGLEGDLHLLPGATHTAEALDASLAAQEARLPALVGCSHDVIAKYQPITLPTGGRMLEATEIVQVNSVDVVADPAAGGRVTRMVAGGITPKPSTTPTTPSQEDNAMNLEQLLTLLRAADATKRAELLTEHAAVLEGAGLTDTQVLGLVPDPTATTDTEPVLVGAATESRTAAGGVELVYARESVMGRVLVDQAARDAGINPDHVATAMRLLPAKFTEAELKRQVESWQAMASVFERADLTPRGGSIAVTADEFDKKIKALDAMFAEAPGGYRSFKEAWADITGVHRIDPLGEDINRRILRDVRGTTAYDSATRGTEAVIAGSTSGTPTFDQLLGDSITRRMLAIYNLANLQTWRKIVSSTPTINDFRIQHIGRLGGYGLLPIVGERAPYQPLTTPTDEEATYKIAKRGGTEDVTLEAIANDDIRAIVQIPKLLGNAAAQTLLRYVFDMLASNQVCSYDATALFAVAHGNTQTVALSQTGLSQLRRSMRKQTAYGDATAFLGWIPKVLVVPPDLEEIAFQLTKSAVAIPGTPAGPSNTPNLHQGLDYVVVDYFTDVNDWYLVADPAMAPTIELGFYQGRQEPEIFTQDDPRVGPAFNNDTVTYKIRHIYAGTPLEHRSFQRGVQ